MKTFALILAGGKGLRMGAELPKQFLPLEGKPMLMRTLEAFHLADSSTVLILVLPISHQAYWKQLCADYHFTLKHQIANGGETRFESVANGLKLVEDQGVIAVHDGVRPLVSPNLIAQCYHSAREKGSVVPVFAVVESLRRLDDSGSIAVDRSRYVSVQTPQTFRSEILLEAYQQENQTLFTDDASVVEAAGFKIFLLEGEQTNIKITTPVDLLLAEQILIKKLC